jgi:predicted amidohydrolase
VDALRVASLQVEVSPQETMSDRLERVAELIAAASDVDVLVLPELWTVSYFDFDRYREAAEPMGGPTVTRVASAAVAAGLWLLAGSIIERDGDSLYNTSVLLDPSGNVVASYRKVHLFGYRSQEREVLQAGRDICVVDSPIGRVGLSTCYDLRFPELYRAMVDDGAEVFIVPSAWPYPRVEAWTTLNRARALENQAWLISANCCGGQPAQRYCGRSMIVDPFGDVVAGIGDRPGMAVADLDPGLVRSAREEFPFLRHRRRPASVR